MVSSFPQLIVEYIPLDELVACGDVVKKPKLDQHRSRCGSGFDCIDCSTTFNTPAEYKGHTQCISEAEKYQKSLYKGPKTVRRDMCIIFNYRNIIFSFGPLLGSESWLCAEEQLSSIYEW